MNISVVSGHGEGRTTLSAFDAALGNAGVYNYNLIRLSSIIPPGSIVKKVAQYDSPEEEYGDRLYIVMAEYRSQESGKYMAAGIGWYQYDDNRGLFVEHEIIGETRIAVESEIQLRISNSLKDLCKFRNIKFYPAKVKSCLSITQVKGAPTCVLVLAVFQSEAWSTRVE